MPMPHSSSTALLHRYLPIGVYLPTIVNAVILLGLPVALVYLGFERFGIKPLETLVPVYHGSVVLSMGLVSAVVVWFAFTAARQAEAAASRLRVAKGLALLESERSSARFAELIRRLDEPRESGEESASLLSRSSMVLTAGGLMTDPVEMRLRRQAEEPSAE